MTTFSLMCDIFSGVYVAIMMFFMELAIVAFTRKTKRHGHPMDNIKNPSKHFTPETEPPLATY